MLSWELFFEHRFQIGQHVHVPAWRAVAAAVDAAVRASALAPVVERSPSPFPLLPFPRAWYALMQARVRECELAGALEKHELLALAQSRVQLWECRRLAACGTFIASGGVAGLQAAVAAFRLPAGGPTQTLVARVHAASGTLRRTYTRLALLVHPDKARQHGQDAYAAAFDEAFKALNEAHKILLSVAALPQCPAGAFPTWSSVHTPAKG